MPGIDLLPLWASNALASLNEILQSISVELSASQPVEQGEWGGAYIPIDTEQHTYLLSFLAPHEVQIRIAEILFGAGPSQSSSSMRNAMGELTNMMAGATKTLLEPIVGHELSLGLPMFIQGQYFGTTATRTRVATENVSLFGRNCQLTVIEQQLSGDAILRRQAEIRLRDSEEKQRAIIEGAPDAVITADLDGQILSFNSAASESFGLECEEALQSNIASILEYPPNSITDSRSSFNARGRRPNGEGFPVEVNVSFFQFRERAQMAFVARDTTLREAAASALEVANQKLIDISHAAGKAEVAANVLHNVGNVLNSINIATELICDKLENSPTSQLCRAIELLSSHASDLGKFLDDDARGKKMLPFLQMLSSKLGVENTDIRGELSTLKEHVAHIRGIITTQQSVAMAGGIIDVNDLNELADQAIVHSQEWIFGTQIDLVREYEDSVCASTDKNKVLQIMINLVKNACEALKFKKPRNRQIVVRTFCSEESVVFQVEDNGSGIAPEVMDKLFAHGFTTKRDGHGFGLHGCANHAKQLGGELIVRSEGVDRGACFSLHLPQQRLCAVAANA